MEGKVAQKHPGISQSNDKVPDLYVDLKPSVPVTVIMWGRVHCF